MRPIKSPKGYKWCPRCHRHLPFKDFHKSPRERTGRNWCCKQCSSIRAKKYFSKVTEKLRRRKAELVMKFGNQCFACGTKNLPSCCYQFHHKIKTDKNFQIAVNFFHKGIEDELKKCILLCANCHQILHSDSKTAKEIMVLPLKQ